MHPGFRLPVKAPNIYSRKQLQKMLTIYGRKMSLDDVCLEGIKCYQQKDLTEAVKLFGQVVTADPFHPRALNALALIEIEQGNYDQAKLRLDTLLAANPQFDKGYNSRGHLFLKLKNVEDAEKDFHKAIELNPGFAEAYGNLGNLYLLLLRYSQAADCFRKVISLNSGSPKVYTSLANSLTMLGFYDEAAPHIDTALTLDPEYAPAHLCRGDLLRMRGDFPEAIASYMEAVRHKPDSAACHRSLGNVYRDIKDFSSAHESLLEAQRLDPFDPHNELSLGNFYWETRCLFEAEQAYRRGLAVAELSTDIMMLHSGLGSVYLSLGHPDEAIAEFRSGLALDPGNQLLHSDLLLTMYYSQHQSNVDIFRESLAWGENQAVAAASALIHAFQHPLKIGFVSADFRIHSVSYFFEPLLASIDRSRFKIYCYSGVRKPDAATERLKSMTCCWVDCFSIPDELLAASIRAEKIDVLVDLSGHTAGYRLSLFALRPAPVQITWLGYPGTTGLRAIDYRVTDAIADPVGISDTLHTEKLIRLPGCFICYKPPQDAPRVLPPPSIEKKYVTFGSFNNLAKITPQTLAIWCEILNMIDGSRLIIKQKTFVHDDSRTHWQNLLINVGFAPESFDLMPFEASKYNHFARYGEIDIALDTFPYNGTTTTCEALWMGVPVITLSGDRHSSRVSASILSCIGLNELVAESVEEYLEKAVELAVDTKRLIDYRNSMRERMLSSQLCDSAGFARKWEEAIFNLPGIS